MNTYKIIIILLLTLGISSCGGAKYNYSFDRGKKINFKRGKWILNEPYTNYDSKDAYEFAKQEFKEILGDSLLDLLALRQTKIIGKQLPLDPTKSELLEIKEFSNCNFLININSTITRDQMGNSSHQSPNVGTVTKYNEAQTRIKIYDLDKLELISESIAYGQVKVTKRAEDNETIVENLLNYTTPGKTLALKTIKKLIRKYDRYKQE